MKLFKCYLTYIGSLISGVVFSHYKTIIKMLCLPPLNSSGFNRTCATATAPATTHKHQEIKVKEQ